MIRQAFGLTDLPFKPLSSPTHLFPSRQAVELAAKLDRLLEYSAMALLHGETGSGKSTVAHAWRLGLAQNRTWCATLALPSPTPRAFLRQLARHLAEEVRPRLELEGPVVPRAHRLPPLDGGPASLRREDEEQLPLVVVVREGGVEVQDGGPVRVLLYLHRIGAHVLWRSVDDGLVLDKEVAHVELGMGGSGQREVEGQDQVPRNDERR